MSQIDQAFIQAYSDENYTLPIADTVGPEVTGAEPIPAPHFRTAGENRTRADVANMQQAMFTPAEEQTSEVNTAEAKSEQRRPLSAFAEPAPVRTNAFEPVFEVDAFRWPAVTEELLAGWGELLNPVVEQLLVGSEEGRSMVGIAGAQAGVGCSTVQLCLAKLLSATGRSVALVDSNFVAANLAKSLGLDFEAGWEDVLSGKIPLAECAVRSIEDRMVLLPLRSSGQPSVELLSSIQTSVIAGVLRYHYDLVLYDLGAAGREPQLGVAEQIVEHCRMDASIIVADSDNEGGESGQEIDGLMSVLGSTCLGVIGNFASKR